MDRESIYEQTTNGQTNDKQMNKQTNKRMNKMTEPGFSTEPGCTGKSRRFASERHAIPASLQTRLDDTGNSERHKITGISPSESSSNPSQNDTPHVSPIMTDTTSESQNGRAHSEQGGMVRPSTDDSSSRKSSKSSISDFEGRSP